MGLPCQSQMHIPIKSPEPSGGSVPRAAIARHHDPPNLTTIEEPVILVVTIASVFLHLSRIAHLPKIDVHRR